MTPSTTNQHICGLPISARWAGVKLKWLIDNIGSVQDAYKSGDLRFGTLDCWLLWQLTAGDCYATDVTNASYTMLMNLHRCCWDSSICKFLEIDPAILPEIKSCAEMFGTIAIGSASSMGGLAITGSVCDIKANLIGHQGTQPGSVSLDIDPESGTSHITITVGEELLFYRYMLKGSGFVLSTASYQFGSKANVSYSLEVRFIVVCGGLWALSVMLWGTIREYEIDCDWETRFGGKFDEILFLDFHFDQ